jgi:putative transposase
MPRRYSSAPRKKSRSSKSSSSPKSPQVARSTPTAPATDAISIQLCLDRDETILLLQDKIRSFAIDVGLRVAQRLLIEDVDRLCGPRSQRDPDRTAVRHGQQPGVVTIAGQKIRVTRPRVRSVDKGTELPLPMYELMQREEAMPEAALKRMVHGVSCRNYEKVIEAAQDGFGVKRSSISRAFVKASAQEVAAFAERRFDGERFVAIFVDGVEYAGEMMIVALGVLPTGDKQILGIRQGATENAAVTTALLENLVERGVRVEVPTLFVLDGAKALRAAVNRVWGQMAVIQRCQVHKKRNVQAHVPDRYKEELNRRLTAAYTEPHHATAIAHLEGTVRWLSKINHDAAASLSEGLEETLTVTRLGLGKTLRRTFATTNAIESALSMARRMTNRVTKWRDGDMRHRWCTAALRDGEKRFKRVKGYRELGKLVEALESYVASTQDIRPSKLA